MPARREHMQELIDVGPEQPAISPRKLSFHDLSRVRLLRLAGHARRDGWRLALVQRGDQLRRICALTRALDRLPFRPQTALAGP
jgi:hypothetical protein